MKRTILLIPLLLLYVASKGQVVGFTSLGLNVSTHWSYRQVLVENPTDAQPVLSLKESETSEFLMGLDLHTVYTLNHKLGIQTGISWHNYGYRFFGPGLFWFERHIDPDRGALGNPGRIDIANNQFSYLSIPAKLRCRFGRTNLQFVTNTGFSLNHLIRSAAVLRLEDGQVITNKITNQDFRRFNAMLEAGLGIQYKTDGNWGWSIENVFRFGLIKTTETNIADRLYSAGFIFGVFHTLNLE